SYCSRAAHPLVLPLFSAISRPPRATLFPYTTLFRSGSMEAAGAARRAQGRVVLRRLNRIEYENTVRDLLGVHVELQDLHAQQIPDRKSTRLNSSHLGISYAVFCLKKKILITPFMQSV